jgi:hypothetical protein
MTRQKHRRARDTWEVGERGDGVWVSREVPPGWYVGHRVVLQGATPVIAETRVSAPADGPIPAGGLGSDVLRLITVSGVREVAARMLLAKGPGTGRDLRALESLSASARRRGEARRWSLALTSWAYVQAVADGSRHPNEDIAAALGILPRTVRDRLYAARRHRPPLLTGGGRQGLVGRPELTEAGHHVIKDRLERVMASMGMDEFIGYRGTLAAFDATQDVLLQDAERRIPGLWEMSLEEVAVAGADRSTWTEVPAGKGLRVGPEGVAVVDVDEEGRPR